MIFNTKIMFRIRICFTLKSFKRGEEACLQQSLITVPLIAQTKWKIINIFSFFIPIQAFSTYFVSPLQILMGNITMEWIKFINGFSIEITISFITSMNQLFFLQQISQNIGNKNVLLKALLICICTHCTFSMICSQ